MQDYKTEGRRAGRKMTRCKWILDQKTGTTGVFLGYVEDLSVNGKIIIRRDDLTSVMRYIKSDERSFGSKLLKMLLRSRML